MAVKAPGRPTSRVLEDQALSWRSIHVIRKSTMRDWRSGGMSVPFGTFHHFERQSRQQQAQACCALNTGCPRMGVCLPSLGGFAGARRVRMKSSQWHTRRLSGVATHREATALKRKRRRARRGLWPSDGAAHCVPLVELRPVDLVFPVFVVVHLVAFPLGFRGRPPRPPNATHTAVCFQE